MLCYYVIQTSRNSTSDLPQKEKKILKLFTILNCKTVILNVQSVRWWAFDRKSNKVLGAHPSVSKGK